MCKARIGQDTIIGTVIIDFALDAWDWLSAATRRLTGVQFLLLLVVIYTGSSRDDYATLFTSIATFGTLMLMDWRLARFPRAKQSVRKISAVKRDPGKKSEPRFVRPTLIATTALLVTATVLCVLETSRIILFLFVIVLAVAYLVLWWHLGQQSKTLDPANTVENEIRVAKK